MKEYTINTDIQIFAENYSDAIVKLTELLKSVQFWIGEVKKENTK